jgi:hypothetical protein
MSCTRASSFATFHWEEEPELVDDPAVGDDELVGRRRIDLASRKTSANTRTAAAAFQDADGGGSTPSGPSTGRFPTNDRNSRRIAFRRKSVVARDTGCAPRGELLLRMSRADCDFRLAIHYGHGEPPLVFLITGCSSGIGR